MPNGSHMKITIMGIRVTNVSANGGLYKYNGVDIVEKKGPTPIPHVRHSETCKEPVKTKWCDIYKQFGDNKRGAGRVVRGVVKRA